MNEFKMTKNDYLYVVANELKEEHNSALNVDEIADLILDNMSEAHYMTEELDRECEIQIENARESWSLINSL